MRKIFLLLTTLLVLTSVASAAKVDMYRDALLNKSFTLKYEMVEVPVVETSRDAVFTGKGLVNKEPLKLWFDRLHNGIIVMSGNDIYTEQYRDDFLVKRSLSLFTRDIETKFKAGGYGGLVKDGETFGFAWDEDNGKRHYFGFIQYTAKDRSKLNEFKTPYQKLPEDYDSYLMTLADGAFAAILPPEKIIATPQTPEFKLIGSGTLDGGLTYDDFFGNKNGFNCAVRYYFDGDALVKIALFDYVMSEGRVQSYEKCVITVDEFSATPEQNYLQLPAELKDKTKR